MGNIVLFCTYGATTLILALAADYLWMLWIRKQMVQFQDAVRVLQTDTDLHRAAAWTTAMAYCGKHIQST